MYRNQEKLMEKIRASNEKKNRKNDASEGHAAFAILLKEEEPHSPTGGTPCFDAQRSQAMLKKVPSRDGSSPTDRIEDDVIYAPPTELSGLNPKRPQVP